MTCKERDHTKLAATEELNSTLTHIPPSTTEIQTVLMMKPFIYIIRF